MFFKSLKFKFDNYFLDFRNIFKIHPPPIFKSKHNLEIKTTNNIQVLLDEHISIHKKLKNIKFDLLTYILYKAKQYNQYKQILNYLSTIKTQNEINTNINIILNYIYLNKKAFQNKKFKKNFLKYSINTNNDLINITTIANLIVLSEINEEKVIFLRTIQLLEKKIFFRLEKKISFKKMINIKSKGEFIHLLNSLIYIEKIVEDKNLWKIFGSYYAKNKNEFNLNELVSCYILFCYYDKQFMKIYDILPRLRENEFRELESSVQSQFFMNVLLNESDKVVEEVKSKILSGSSTAIDIFLERDIKAKAKFTAYDYILIGIQFDKNKSYQNRIYLSKIIQAYYDITFKIKTKSFINKLTCKLYKSINNSPIKSNSIKSYLALKSLKDITTQINTSKSLKDKHLTRLNIRRIYLNIIKSNKDDKIKTNFINIYKDNIHKFILNKHHLSHCNLINKDIIDSDPVLQLLQNEYNN
jgi:hypothetical protein